MPIWLISITRRYCSTAVSAIGRGGSEIPRVAHEHVQPAEVVDGGVDGGAPVVLARDVEVHVPRRVTEIGRDRGTGVVEHVTEQHPRSFGRELPCLGFPLPARGAGDERDLAVESVRHGRHARTCTCGPQLGA